MTCEICSSDGAIEAMLATGSGDVGVGGICWSCLVVETNMKKNKVETADST